MTMLRKILQHVFNIAIAKVTATGSAMHLCPGFIPHFVLVYNKTNPSFHLWWRTMTAAHCVQIGNHADTQIAHVTSACFTAFAGEEGDGNDGSVSGADGTNDFYIKYDPAADTPVYWTATVITAGLDLPQGITIGTNAVLNTASDELHVLMIKMF